MKLWISRAVIALMFLSLIGVGCNRTVDNTNDDKTGKDLVGGEDTESPDDDLTVDPEGDATILGKDVNIPEGCGAVGLTVNDLQTRPEGLNCQQPAEGESGFINLDQGAELNCLIATSQVHDATDTLDSFYAADVGGGEYSGIKIVMPKGTAPAIAIGDVVSMVGDLKEYYCLSEFEPVDVQVFANNGVPLATSITVETLNADPEKWEGVLVKIANATVESLDNYGGFVIEGGLTVDDMIFADMTPLEEGCEYLELVGVIEFGYGSYKLLPRSDADLVPAPGDCEQVGPSTTTIADIQNSETSLTCNDEAFVDGGSVSLKGLVATTPRYVVSNGKLHGFFASSVAQTTGDFSGILVVTEWGDDIDLEVGAIFDLEADWTEYYCLTELNATKLTPTGDVDAGKVQATAATAATIGEALEGVVVDLEGQFTVIEEANQYGEVLLSDDIVVKLKFEGVDWAPAVGEAVNFVVGPVEYSFGKYKIMPVSIDDIGYQP